ncbi:hypothetical protein [Paraburkholderia sediminicola]|uniref:hypothetical protein n=1 Tax=Paraburkholderia sediminicola TaxID=458836 RepID=UPI0038BB29F3
MIGAYNALNHEAADFKSAPFTSAYRRAEPIPLRVEQVLLDIGTRSLPLRHLTTQYDTGIDAPKVQG